MMLSESDVCLSVAYTEPKSRTERPKKIKIGTQVAHVTRDSDITFKVKKSKVKVTRPLYSPPCWSVRQLQRWAWESVGRGKLLGGARRFGDHGGGEGRGHIVAPARLQLVYFYHWRTQIVYGPDAGFTPVLLLVSSMCGVCIQKLELKELFELTSTVVIRVIKTSLSAEIRRIACRLTTTSSVVAPGIRSSSRPMVFIRSTYVFVSVCLSVSRITEKVVNEFL